MLADSPFDCQKIRSIGSGSDIENGALGREGQAFPSGHKESVVTAVEMEAVAFAVGDDEQRRVSGEILGVFQKFYARLEDGAEIGRA